MVSRTRQSLEYYAIATQVDTLANTIGAYIFSPPGNPALARAHAALVALFSDKSQEKAARDAKAKAFKAVEDILAENEAFGAEPYVVTYKGSGPLDIYREFVKLTPDSSLYELTTTAKFIRDAMPNVVKLGEQVAEQRRQRTAAATAKTKPRQRPKPATVALDDAEVARLEKLELDYATGVKILKPAAPRFAAPVPAPESTYRMHVPAGSQPARGVLLRATTDAGPRERLISAVDTYVRGVIPIYLRVISGDNAEMQDTGNAIAAQDAITPYTDMVPWATVGSIVQNAVAPYAISPQVMRAFGDTLEVVSATQNTKKVTAAHTTTVANTINITNNEILRLLSTSKALPQPVKTLLGAKLSLLADLFEQNKAFARNQIKPVAKGHKVKSVIAGTPTAAQVTRTVVDEYGEEVERTTIDAIEICNICNSIVFGAFNARSRRRQSNNSLFRALLEPLRNVINPVLVQNLVASGGDMPYCTDENSTLVDTYTHASALQQNLANLCGATPDADCNTVDSVLRGVQVLLLSCFVYNFLKVHPALWPKGVSTAQVQPPAKSRKMPKWQAMLRPLAGDNYEQFREALILDANVDYADYAEATLEPARSTLIAKITNATQSTVTSGYNIARQMAQSPEQAVQQQGRSLETLVLATLPRLEKAGIAINLPRQNFSTRSSSPRRFRVT
jgi:hypothetical protein